MPDILRFLAWAHVVLGAGFVVFVVVALWTIWDTLTNGRKG